MAGKSVAKQEEQSGAVALPDFMKGAQVASSNIEASDIELPRLKLLQSLSPELEDGHKAGDLFHHVMEQSLGSEIEITPIFVFKSYILWNPRKSGGGILARADDGKNWNKTGEWEVTLDGSKKKVTWTIDDLDVKKSGLADWGSSDPDDPDSPPAATKMLNVVAHVHGHESLSPVIIPFQRGLLKAGTRLVSKINLSSIPVFGQKYALGTEKTANSDGEEFYTFKTRGAGHVTDEGLFRTLQERHKMFAEMTISVVDIESMQGDADSSDGSGEDEEIAGRV